MSEVRHRAALLLAGLGVVAYLLLSHLLMSRAPDHPATLLLLFGPFVAGLLWAGWSQRRAAPALGGFVAALLLAWFIDLAMKGTLDSRHAYVAQHAAMHLMLAWVFASTLRPGRTPLITALARGLHGHTTAELDRYTTALTRLWLRFFVGMVLLSLMIFLLLPWSWWSAFCVLLTPALALGLFIGEYLWRCWRHPEFERVGPAQAWRAWQTFQQSWRQPVEPR